MENITIADKTYNRLIRIYKNVVGRDPITTTNLGPLSRSAVITLIINQLGNALGIK